MGRNPSLATVKTVSFRVLSAFNMLVIHKITLSIVFM